MSEAKLKLKQGGMSIKIKGKSLAALKKLLGWSEDEPLTMGKIGRAMNSSGGRTMGNFARSRRK